MDEFIITTIEVLKRRNKHNDPCLVDWKHVDDLVLNKHLNRVGCSAPYHKTHFPVCTTKEKMQESLYEVTDIRRREYFPYPCQEISNILYTYQGRPITSNESVFRVSVVYPGKMRIVTQHRLIDVQVLIGNIGGYIGLFLGKQVILI